MSGGESDAADFQAGIKAVIGAASVLGRMALLGVVCLMETISLVRIFTSPKAGDLMRKYPPPSPATVARITLLSFNVMIWMLPLSPPKRRAEKEAKIPATGRIFMRKLIYPAADCHQGHGSAGRSAGVR